jgi:hypothetical protein
MTPTFAFSPSFNVLPRLCRVVHSVALGVANPEGLGRYSVGLKIKRRRTPQIQNLPGVVTEYWCTAMLHVGNRFDIDFHLVCSRQVRYAPSCIDIERSTEADYNVDITAISVGELWATGEGRFGAFVPLSDSLSCTLRLLGRQPSLRLYIRAS